jgi:SAM-dependent MidA family methyltransferase
MTVAAFMETALYAPGVGYYARAAQRSGRTGDFFTSVDVGPLFGELLEVQLEEMARLISTLDPQASHGGGLPHQTPEPTSHVRFDLVEAGAGNGRLSADVLRAARRHHPAFYDRLGLHLVEASEEARAAQRAVLGDTADRLVSSTDALPASFDGALVANELVDALPVHQVVMRDDGLREVYVDAVGDDLLTREGALSTPALAEYLTHVGVRLEPGWRAEINLRALDWIRDAARRLRRGFIILIDYGHEACELYSAQRAGGTLTTFTRHTMGGPEPRPDAPAWLQRPGEQDITAHVDFTSLRVEAEAAGLTTLGFVDQTYFLLGLVSGHRVGGGGREAVPGEDRGKIAGTPQVSGGGDPDGHTPRSLFRERLALKTLLMPGGLGSTHKVLLLGKNVGAPVLRGCSFGGRVT